MYLRPSPFQTSKYAIVDPYTTPHIHVQIDRSASSYKPRILSNRSVDPPRIFTRPIDPLFTHYTLHLCQYYRLFQILSTE